MRWFALQGLSEKHTMHMALLYARNAEPETGLFFELALRNVVN